MQPRTSENIDEDVCTRAPIINIDHQILIINIDHQLLIINIDHQLLIINIDHQLLIINIDHQYIHDLTIIGTLKSEPQWFLGRLHDAAPADIDRPDLCMHVFIYGTVWL